MYSKGGLWLPSIGFTNSLCARFSHMTTSHAPIEEYRQRFFPHLPTNYLCSNAEIQTHEHIVMECNLYPSTCLYNNIINSFIHFLVDNPGTFSFDNRWDLIAVWLLWVKAQHLSPIYSSFFFFFFSLYLSRYYVPTTVCLHALCNKSLN